MHCASKFKSGNHCHHHAKYTVISAEGGHKVRVCSRHLEEESKKIPSPMVELLPKPKRLTPMSTFKLVAAMIRETAGMDIRLVEQIEANKFRVAGSEAEYVLSIYTREAAMVESFEAMCIQYESLKHSRDIFLPIVSYLCGDRHCFVAKPAHHPTPYFYQLKELSYPLPRQCPLNGVYAVIEHMCSLIERMYAARMCFGDFNQHTLVLMNSDDISSARLETACNITFWRDTRGEYTPETQKCAGSAYPITTSRRVHSRHAPCRYDDFESLLYLVFSLSNSHALPWTNPAPARVGEMNEIKTQFLENPSEYGVQVTRIRGVW